MASSFWISKGKNKRKFNKLLEKQVEDVLLMTSLSVVSYVIQRLVDNA